MTEEMPRYMWSLLSIAKLLSIVGIFIGLQMTFRTDSIVASLISGGCSSLYVLADMQQQKYSGVTKNER